MDPLHARYPFLAAAREAVDASGADLTAVVADDGPVVERALDRITNAVDGQTVGDAHRTPRVELLSYPVARILVSLVDEPGLTRRYARAEARTAYERFTADLDAVTELRSVGGERITLDELLREFDRRTAVTEAADGFRVQVAAYLELAGDLSADRWRLHNRTLADGAVPVSHDELYELLRAAVRDRVATDLPLSVPPAIADPLADPVAALRDRLVEFEPGREFGAVVPDGFPPCVRALLARVDGDGALPPQSLFALTTFLATVGVPTDEIVDRYADHPGLDETEARALVAHLRNEDGPAAYPAPSCATMQAHGDCVNRDALCETIAHPLEYYERRLDGAGASPPVDGATPDG